MDAVNSLFILVIAGLVSFAVMAIAVRFAIDNSKLLKQQNELLEDIRDALKAK